MNSAAPRVVVVGAGISGLAAAWYAAEAGASVLVLEAAPRVGGKLQVVELAGVAVDVGAEALLTTRPEALELLDAAGLAGERIAPLSTAAGIYAGGRLARLPAGTLMGIPFDADALAASGAVSDAAVHAVRAEAGQKPLPPLDAAGDVAVGRLVRQRLGDEVADRLVDPLLGGVYSGRADQLSLRATVPGLAQALAGGGSLTEAARAVVAARRPSGSGSSAAPPAGTRIGSIFTALRGGVGRLPTALVGAGRFEVRTSTTVRSLRRTPTGFELDCGATPVSQLVTADSVIVALPPSKAARLLRSVAPGASTELAGVDSASSAIVSLAFDGATALPAGSGLLIASGERLATKAVTFSSQKWPVGAGADGGGGIDGGAGGPVLLRASVGRAGETTALQFDDADLTMLVRRELRALTGVAAEPIATRVTRWGGGLPQYDVGHLARMERVRAAVGAVPGLAACGAAFDGVGVPACIASARAAVRAALGERAHW